jgi:lipopolysaccharide export LptBFGC system permease protein LptF
MSTNRRLSRPAAVAVAALLAVSVSACGSTKATQGGSTGAGIGALASGLLGGNMVTGALIGGGIGYIAGNEADKRDAENLAQQRQAALERSRITDNTSTAVVVPRQDQNSLTGSTWQVLSINPDDEIPAFSGMVVTFATNSRVTTLTAWADGKVETTAENYRVVDDILVFSGRDPDTGEDYAVTMTFSIENGQMLVVAQDLKIVLREVEEGV